MGAHWMGVLCLRSLFSEMKKASEALCASGSEAPLLVNNAWVEVIGKDSVQLYLGFVKCMLFLPYLHCHLKYFLCIWSELGIPSHTHLFIQQIFINFLLCARYTESIWGHKIKERRTLNSSEKALFLEPGNLGSNPDQVFISLAICEEPLRVSFLTCKMDILKVMV